MSKSQIARKWRTYTEMFFLHLVHTQTVHSSKHGAVPIFSRKEGGNGQVALLAGLPGMPVCLAGRAELQGADSTLDQLWQRRGIHFFELAHSLAGGGGAPRPAGIQQHLCWNRVGSSDYYYYFFLIFKTCNTAKTEHKSIHIHVLNTCRGGLVLHENSGYK